MFPLELKKRNSRGGRVEEIVNGWRLSLDPGKAGEYRLAQLDDYSKLPRGAFPHRPPLRFELQARASHANLPGTWGFGLWNDPFGFSLGLGGTPGRLPALPNAAWFFFASPENHLSLQDQQPGNGALAAVYATPSIPAPLFVFALPVIPFLAWRPALRLLRRVGSRLIRQNVTSLDHDVREWHRYALSWRIGEIRFEVDGRLVLSSALKLHGPLALVLWIDNQFAAWRPDGSLARGTLTASADHWVEIKNFSLN